MHISYTYVITDVVYVCVHYHQKLKSLTYRYTTWRIFPARNLYLTTVGSSQPCLVRGTIPQLVGNQTPWFIPMKQNPWPAHFRTTFTDMA